jgi:DNA-binding response OmpR family regulator
MSSRGGGPALAGRRVLVVEDEWLIAAEIGRALEAAGAVVLGPALSVGEALALLRDGAPPPDAALLDVNLRGEPVTPVALALAGRGVPFALVTAYGAGDLGEPLLRAAPRVGKPFAAAGLVRAVARLRPGAG